MQTREYKREKGFTLLELIIVIAIISMVTAAVVPVYLRNLRDRELEADIEKLYFDLIEAREYSIAEMFVFSGYKFYGIEFVNSASGQGYRMVAFLSDPATSSNTKIIKSNIPGDKARVADNTLFHHNVIFDAASELQPPEYIVFSREGLATRNGAMPLATDNDAITLQCSTTGASRTIQIFPALGRVEIQ